MAIPNTPTGIQIIGLGSAVARAVGAPKGTARVGLARDGWSGRVSEGRLDHLAYQGSRRRLRYRAALTRVTHDAVGSLKMPSNH